MVVYRCGLVLSPPDTDTVPFPVAAVVPDHAPRHRPSGSPGRIGVPAVQRRAIGVVARGLIERAATTPMARRRPASWPGEQTASRLPREPGSAIVREARRCRMVVPAQWRTRHPAGAGFPAWPGRLRALSLMLSRTRSLVPVAVPAPVAASGRFLPAPAFWAAVTHLRPSGPASRHRRGRAWVD